MAPHQLAEDIGEGRRGGRDRPVLEMALDVLDELGGRVVAVVPAAGDGLGHDPVEIALETPNQTLARPRKGVRTPSP